ncbi:unnamed protein product [Mytilus coruscus]|uniref:LRRNT domain-containing protein n=1 Tax=Mytilus coruscus TaxID=42192 RepID=A0A6J8DDY1_MYTCO|nr:unnamed protein product [Mytilus coruscus]CAC5406159.1 unnamed protein product [Mytilus coruscus]
MRQTILLIVCTVFKSTVLGCPGACNCYGSIVDCNSKSLSTVPSGIPSSTIILYLQNNRISSLDINIFNGLTQLQRLNLNGNQITSLDENIFNGLAGLQELKLNDNQMTSLDGNIFNGLTALQTLDLAGNVLDCSNCELEQLKFFLQNHTVGDAGAMCNGTKVVDYDFIKCIEMTTEGASVTTQHQTNLYGISTDSTTHLHLIIVAAVCGVVLCVISIIIISYIYCHYKSKRSVNSINVD